MARPKDIGTRAESAVVRALRGLGWPHAERRALAGAYDLGDITGTPGICWEVKGGEAAKSASDALLTSWLAETEVERVNARADVGVLVVQRRGVGPANAHRWWAWTTTETLAALLAPDADRDPTAYSPPRPSAPVRMMLGDLAQLLRWAGYGTPLDEAVAS